MQANLTPLGQRRNVCGMKKSTMFVADFAATELVQFVLACALLIYMRFVLNLQIGERYAAIVLLLFVGTSFGIVFGMLIGSIAHLSQGGKIGVLVSSNLVLCAMSDLMISGIKGVIEKTVPIVNDISPAALITDAFYALNVYDTYERFFVDVLSLAGFNWLVRLVYGLCGGEWYEVVFAVFAFVTLLLFLKAMYEQSVDFAFSYFLFMTLGLYFQTYNTVRYYLVLAIALYAMRYVLQRDWIKFIFWIFVASLFHKSVLFIIPVYWIASFVWKKWFIITCVIISTLCFLCKKYVLKLALFLYPSYENTVFLKGGTS